MFYGGWREKKMAQRSSWTPQIRQPQILSGGFRPGFRPGMYNQGDFLGALIKVGASAIKSIGSKLIPKHTVVGKILSGGIKTAPSVLAGAGAAAAVDYLTPKGTAGVPALPGAMAAGPAMPAPQQGALGALGSLIPWYKGPGGHLQFPWQDPTFMQGLQPPFVLDDSYLKQIIRAPRGYVVVHDKNGRAYCMWKPIAQRVGAWHPARKPPISAGDWHKYETARTVEKKLRKLASHALRKHSRIVHLDTKHRRAA